MYIEIRNQATLTNRHIRFLKWKLYGLKRKFKQMLYAEVFVKSEGNTPKTYQANLKIGVPGHDLIIKNKSISSYELFIDMEKLAHRKLVSYKRKKKALNQ